MMMPRQHSRKQRRTALWRLRAGIGCVLVFGLTMYAVAFRQLSRQINDNAQEKAHSKNGFTRNKESGLTGEKDDPVNSRAKESGVTGEKVTPARNLSEAQVHFGDDNKKQSLSLRSQHSLNNAQEKDGRSVEKRLFLSGAAVEQNKEKVSTTKDQNKMHTTGGLSVATNGEKAAENRAKRKDREGGPQATTNKSHATKTFAHHDTETQHRREGERRETSNKAHASMAIARHDGTRQKRTSLETTRKEKRGQGVEDVSQNASTNNKGLARRGKIQRRQWPATTHQYIPPVERESLLNTTKFDLERPTIPDPLMQSLNKSAIQRLPFRPQVPYLGVWVDAGRQYFTITWLKRLIRYLSYMGYNLIHFRLTDDQAFNVRLDSHPEFAKPTAVNSNGTVYTPSQLRDLVAYAQQRNIAIMPEINVPGHAASWHGVPDMIVPCPEFICQKGYGLPLNVEHPDVMKILKEIITEVKDIFHTSPFMHLGGDEVEMALPCFFEAGRPMFDYDSFETALGVMLNEINVTNVIRWEMTGQEPSPARVVTMVQYWYSRNYRVDDNGNVRPFFASHGLYFDTNGQEDAFVIYRKTREYLTSVDRPTAIVAGTFELGMDTWLDRNIMGRLVAVAMGASGENFTTIKTDAGEQEDDKDASAQEDNEDASEQDFDEEASEQDDDLLFESEEEEDGEEVIAEFAGHYLELCKSLSFDETLCKLFGRPAVSEEAYKTRWNDHWSQWKKDACTRLTIETPGRELSASWSVEDHRSTRDRASGMFWNAFGAHFARPYAEEDFDPKKAKRPKSIPSSLRQHTVPYRGIVIDLVREPPGPNVEKRFEDIIDVLAELGFNVLQLRLMDDLGMAVELSPLLSLRRSDVIKFTYDLAIQEIVEYAFEKGIMVLPEISISTRAGGWSDRLEHMACPNVICERGYGIPLRFSMSSLLPVLAMVLKEVKSSFSSKYIHLGFDEREEATACFNEARMSPRFDTFEEKLEELLRIERIPPEHVLRWENTERKQYEKRAGGVTHYRFSSGPTNTSDPWFVSTNLAFDDPKSSSLNAWSIYKETRALAQKSPTGVLASVGFVSDTSWSTLNVKGRLLAMAMGLSNRTITSEEKFWDKYNKTCNKLDGYSCGLSGTMKRTMTDMWWKMQQEVSHMRVNSACSLRTVNITKHTSRVGVLVGANTSSPNHQHRHVSAGKLAVGGHHRVRTSVKP